jgi:hypothetical protein
LSRDRIHSPNSRSPQVRSSEKERNEKQELQEFDTLVAALKQKLEATLKDRTLVAKACFEGLKSMLQSSDFPVLPKVLITEGISPSQWFENKDCMSQIMASDMVQGMGMPVEIEVVKSAEAEKLLGIIEWRKLLQDVLLPKAKTLIDLGLVWYLSSQGGEAWVVAVSETIDPTELAERVTELAEQLEEKSMIEGADEKQPKVEWKDVFRLPL